MLSGKTVVITGSSRGIGLETAGVLLARGANVVVSARTAAAVARATESLAGGHPAGEVVGIACDVTDRAQVEALRDGAVARFGRIDVWVNNAGVLDDYGPLAEKDPAQFAAVLSTNLLGTILCCHAVIPHMVAAGGGQILNMGGLGSFRAARNHAVYGATKGGIVAFTRAVAMDYAGTGVRIHCVVPGLTATAAVLAGGATASGRANADRRRQVAIYAVTPAVTARRLADLLESTSAATGRAIRFDTSPARVLKRWLAGVWH